MYRHLVLGSLLAAACGDDGASSVDETESTEGTSSTSTTQGESTEPSSSVTGTTAATEGADMVPPEVRDVRVSIDEGSLFDLNNAHIRRVLPDPAPAEFTVRTEDDLTEDEDLVVAVVDAESGDVVSSEGTFVNGLWRVPVDVRTATSYRVRVTDEAGNSTDGEYALLIPSLAEAMVGQWDSFEYDLDSIAEIYTLTVNEDGTWSETAQMGSSMRSGSWSVDETELTLVEAVNSEGDTDPASDDFARVSSFYVDQDYLVPRPFLAEDGQDSNAQGTWSRSWTEQEPGPGGSLEDARTIEETLVLASGGNYSLTRTTTPTSGSATQYTESGSWDVELNGEYFANYGDFLVLTIDDIDGTTQNPPVESWALHRARSGRLLVEPYVPSQ